jgi:hypothetical protein
VTGPAQESEGERGIERAVAKATGGERIFISCPSRIGQMQAPTILDAAGGEQGHGAARLEGVIYGHV